MRFIDLLARADDELLQSLVGSRAVRLITYLDEKSASPSHLRQIALDLKHPSGLLLNPQHRAALLELLPLPEAHLLVTALQSSPQLEPYIFLTTFRCSRGSEKERRLFEFFELRPPPVEPKPTLPASATREPTYSLFEHQRRAAREATEYLEREPFQVLLHMPTGSGKTRTAMNIIADHLRAGEPRLVVWLAYSEELCEQAAEEFEQTWRFLGNRSITVSRFWGGYSPDLTGLRDGFIVVGLAKLYRTTQSYSAPITLLSSRCSMVVMDEAHQAIAETYRFMLRTLFETGRQAAMLGLTATPGRTWNNIAADQELADFFGRRKVTLTVPNFSNPIDFLTNEQYLAKIIFRPLTYKGGLSLSPADLRSIENELDIPPRFLEKLAEDDQRNLLILVEATNLAFRHRRILIFAASVAHSELLATVLRARGLDASSLTGNTPNIERTQIIEDFKSGQPQTKILVNYGILTTGFDAPKTSAVVIARPTKSLVLYSQMVGRAIRGVRAGGNEEAEIVTVIDQALPGFGSVAQAFENWEDVWKKPTASAMT